MTFCTATFAQTDKISHCPKIEVIDPAGIAELKNKYKAEGLKIFAVHMPRYAADSDVSQFSAAVAQHGIEEYVAIDNRHKIKDAFQNEQGWVPVYYLFDAEGKLKTRAAGEFGTGVLKTALEKMFPAQAATA